MKRLSIIAMALLACTLFAQPIFAGTMQVERLNRGLVAVRVGQGYFLSWRLLANEPYNTGFNVYRGTTRLNSTPITGATIYTDASGALNSTYTIRAIVNGTEQAASDPAILMNNMDGANAGYLHIPLQRPQTGQHGGTYTPNDGSVGDLTGNGVYDIVLKWDPSNAQDNANSGTTDNVLIDAYTLTGTRLWRIDLGPNIRAGAHYTQFMVYDFDGCGKAEVIMKTAPGTRDGTSALLRLGPAATANHSTTHRNSSGYILAGPEFLTVFSGETGRELATVDYWPERGTVSSWGDNYGNRVDRFNAVVAYLDGERPSAVFQRGYYTRMTFAAWDWRNGQLTRRWTFDSNASGNSAYAGQGNHSLSVADVDNSGRHSIITGSAVIGPDGRGRHTKGYGHGDALHVAHMIKGNPYPQIFMPHETGSIGLSLRHANTGDVIFTINNSGDVGRGVAGVLDAAVPGFKFWSSANGNMYGINGTVVGQEPMIPNNGVSYNFVIWWDGDLTRQLLCRNQINKWNVRNNTNSRLLTATGAVPGNGTKRTPVLTADIFGDWREEVIWAQGDNALRIYMSTMTTQRRLVTMMHDPTYRVAVAWQNSSYNQPPHPGYYIAPDMDFPPPVLDVAVVGSTVQPPDPCVANPGSTACCNANPNHASCHPCALNPGSTACCTANPTHTSCPPPDPCVANPGSTACCNANPNHASCHPCTLNPGSTACCTANPTHASCPVAQQPTVNITAPANNARFLPGQTINITVTATAPGNSVTRVEFFNGTTRLGERTATPYTFAWTNPPAGNHTITARVTNAANANATSAGVSVMVAALIGSGTEFIDSLILFDPANATNWAIQSNLATTNRLYGDRDHTIATIPPSTIQGAEWVRTSMDTRSRTAPDTLARFRMRRNATVYIAHEDRVSPRPAWLAARGFTASGQSLTVNDVSTTPATARTFTIYQRPSTQGTIIALGPNSSDGTTSSMMYMVAVREPQTMSTLDRTKILNTALKTVRTGNGVRIDYTLKDKANVRIDLFDIKGNRIKTLINTSKGAGAYSEQISVDGLAAGTYIVKMRAGSLTLQERVLVAK